ncbi:MAG TPA: helix-hairpin-helix domain-containing protein [Longimicrobium sp.]|nr:helix-hairpin-helix domain-containing protein [Longimicrobium sp.]
MAATPQERMALGVVALLLAAGAAARALRHDAPPAELGGPPGAEASAAGLISSVEDSVARAERRRVPLAPGERLDPNTASADELDRLPRVGPALAQRIVAARQGRRFRTLADLDSLPGVGPALLREIGPHLALAPAPAARPASPRYVTGGAAPSSAGVLDLNTATTTELEALPGVGPALAERIVRRRREHGSYTTVEQLREVPGIGPSLLARIRPLVRAGS